MSAPFADDDRAFIRGILTSPADFTGWLAYADFLDERNDPRAEFLRLELRKDDPDLSPTARADLLARVEELREQFDPEWVAVFDRPKVENCRDPFAYRCPEKWEHLRATDDPEVRVCDACRDRVHYCHTLTEARKHAGMGHCVAVSLGVERYPNDLRPAEEYVTMGIMLPDPPPAPDEPPRRRWRFW